MNVIFVNAYTQGYINEFNNVSEDKIRDMIKNFKQSSELSKPVYISTFKNTYVKVQFLNSIKIETDKRKEFYKLFFQPLH
ncbi:hypothetical protein DES38_1243 [Streptohalobacillus salinus]|uniref:Uncharacterized protein n=1 Tax=Streptohalobacillus salinus TaxID=621096 RepID=A0A2V3VVT4_9BACI|nr:hypothetical protein [Streptohalobacillus salinus]PXW86093.1 hypothetical protein DES38_1243 [Streptohalobacillus salinus]